MVIFEACKSLCDVKTLSNKDLMPMVQVLTVFLASSNSVNKFVALKLLNKLISNISNINRKVSNDSKNKSKSIIK